VQFRLLSDIHLEFYRPADVARVIAALDFQSGETCVLAGDIASATCLPRVAMLADAYPDTTFLWVPGNHEYYQGMMHVVDREMADVADSRHNLHLLNPGTHGRFVGATLWYARPADMLSWYNWSDARVIRGAGGIFERATRDRQFLQDHVQADSIVITHMLPHEACIAPRWRDETTNAFFVHDCNDIITSAEPPLWVFGHTHDCIDVRVASTRLVANPVGYPHEAPSAWDPYLTLEVPDGVA